MDYSLLIIVAAFLAFLIFSNKKRAKAAKQLEESVQVGARVVMLGGIKGRIVSILEESVIVETTPGNRIEFVKAAVRCVEAPSLDVPTVPATTTAPEKKPAVAKKTSTAKKPASSSTKTITEKTAK
jgi:preprotein translocase subunit YajC